ncbi:MAG: hypothetical protein KDA50_08680 [Rhodobacteraceae bacterium]|nr:hypothetical protein [Paracoccaceae bacterium]
MTEISELEHRLADALGRMRMAHQSTRRALVSAKSRIDSLEDLLEQAQSTAATQPEAAPAAADPAEIDALKADLQAASAEAARLQQELTNERAQTGAVVRQAEGDRAALETAKAELTALKSSDRLGAVQSSGRAEDLQARVGMLESIVGQLQMANAQLRQNNELLRAAHANGGADPALINDSLTAELESLKAARAADRAEIDSVLAALQPLIEETADA